MMNQICAHIHNYFTAPGDVHRGAFRIEDGTMALPFMLEGQYFRMAGSAMNDGVYRYPAENLADEAFTGEVWAMRVPADLIALASEIAQWQAQYSAAASGPYQSESFGGYSYSKFANLNARGAGGSAWQNVFRSRLDPYRKLA